MVKMLIIKYFLKLLFIKFVVAFYTICAFNIDTKAPILKHGPISSHFGYQVNFYTKSNGQKLIFVGAPGVKYDRLEYVSGGVYMCEYNSSDRCEPLSIRQLTAGVYTDNMWLGGAIGSQSFPGGKLVFCAHRYKKDNWGEGQCFIMNSDFEYEGFMSPCGGDREKEKGHEQFGMCQAGVAVEFTEGDNLLVGLPGAYTWKGALANRVVTDSLDADDSEYLSKVVQDSPTKPYSYLGMSLASGHLLADPSELTFVGGAPRSRGLGEVVFFTKPKVSGSSGSEDLNTRGSVLGEQFGSSFGFSLAVLDVNKDGLDDLLVGAPFYRDKWLGGAVYLYLNKPTVGITSRTKPQRLTSELLSKSECKKVNCINAQFGHTLAGIGDINLDGYQDVAVGAPYQGSGVVYIYNGGPEGLTLSQKIHEASFPYTFGSSIHGGTDLDNNGYPDIVVGSYEPAKLSILRTRPIVEVSYLLEAIPTLIDPSSSSCPVDNTPHNCLHLRLCFRLNTPKTNTQKTQVTLQYKLEAELFTGSTISRVTFDENRSQESLERSLKVDVSEQQCYKHKVLIRENIRDILNPIPFRLTYKLDNPNEPSQRPNQPIPSLDDYPIMDESATNETIMVHFKKNCGSDSLCKSNLKLQASLDLPRNAEGVYRLRVGMDKEVTLNLRVENPLEDAHESTFFVNITNNFVFAGLNNDKGEILCDIEKQPISCNLGNPLPGKGKREFGIRLDTRKATSSKELVTIAMTVNTTSEEVDMDDNSLELKMEIKVETDLAIRGSSVPAGVFYSGEAKGESVVVKEDDVGPEVKHSYEIKNIGNATVERSNVVLWWPYELQSKHPHGKHLLYLMDPPLVDENAECSYDPTIINPLNLKVDYMRELQQMKHREMNKAANAVREAAYKSEEEEEEEDDENFLRRLKRQVEARTGSLSFADSSSYVKKLDCDDGSAKCHVIRCKLGELKQGQSIVIRLRARLWNSTFIQEFKKYDSVHVTSKAHVTIDPALNIQQTDTLNDVLKITTVVQPEFKETRRVAWWVVLLAVLVGLLLLVLLILLLWKCGFFKRNRGAHMTSHKAEMLKKDYDEDE